MRAATRDLTPTSTNPAAHATIERQRRTRNGPSWGWWAAGWRCLAVIVSAIQTDPAHRAGLTASTGARTGVVTLIQRFGSALNLNVHLHMLIVDGVYTLEQNGPRFHRVGAPDARNLERLLKRLVRRIARRLTRDGLLIEDPEQPWLDLEPSDTLDHLNAASIRYRIAVGQGAGGRTLTLKNPAVARTESTPKPFTVNRDGFSRNAAVACRPPLLDVLHRQLEQARLDRLLHELGEITLLRATSAQVGRRALSTSSRTTIDHRTLRNIPAKWRNLPLA